MRASFCLLVSALAAVVLWGPRGAVAAEPLKVAVLKFGTVNWLMDVVRHHRLDARNGFSLDILPLAGKSATAIALLGGEADAIVTDWFWVLRQRTAGRDFVMVPYSRTLGAIMVRKGAGLRTLADLEGKRIGVAGGPLDKSWLLVRARARSGGAGDLADTAEPVFAAPPLLSEQFVAGRLDAVLTFWPYAARLEGQGYRRLQGMTDVMRTLGIAARPPLIGFVFSEAWAKRNDTVAAGLVAALRQANAILATSDPEWDRLRPLMKARSDAEFRALKSGYRSGILTSWGPTDREAARKLFDIVAKLGGRKLVGEGTAFDTAVFWRGFAF